MKKGYKSNFSIKEDRTLSKNNVVIPSRYIPPLFCPHIQRELEGFYRYAFLETNLSVPQEL